MTQMNCNHKAINCTAFSLSCAKEEEILSQYNHDEKVLNDETD